MSLGRRELAGGARLDPRHRSPAPGCRASDGDRRGSPRRERSGQRQRRPSRHPGLDDHRRLIEPSAEAAPARPATPTAAATTTPARPAGHRRRPPRPRRPSRRHHPPRLRRPQPPRPTRWPASATPSAGRATGSRSTARIPLDGVRGPPVIASEAMSFPRLSRPGLAALVALVTLLVAACNYVETTPPAPTPADFERHGHRVRQARPPPRQRRLGRAGLRRQGPASRPRSRSTPSGLDQATPVRLYLYAFADRATFERLRSSIDACARTYVTDPQTFESIEESPYVIAAQGPWGTQFEATLRTALKAAAGTGDRSQAPE